LLRATLRTRSIAGVTVDIEAASLLEQSTDLCATYILMDIHIAGWIHSIQRVLDLILLVEPECKWNFGCAILSAF